MHTDGHGDCFTHHKQEGLQRRVFEGDFRSYESSLIAVLLAFVLGACATSGAATENTATTALKATLRETPLVLTEVVQGSAGDGDSVEVYCASAAGCSAFVVCSGDEASPTCSALQPELPSQARVVVARGTVIGREDWVWLADGERRELANTRVGLFDCADGQGRARADCALAAFSACAAPALGMSAGLCPTE